MNVLGAKPTGWVCRAFVAVVRAIGAILAMLLVVVALIVAAVVVWLAYALWPVYLLCALFVAMFRRIWRLLCALIVGESAFNAKCEMTNEDHHRGHRE